MKVKFRIAQCMIALEKLRSSVTCLSHPPTIISSMNQSLTTMRALPAPTVPVTFSFDHFQLDSYTIMWG